MAKIISLEVNEEGLRNFINSCKTLEGVTPQDANMEEWMRPVLAFAQAFSLKVEDDMVVSGDGETLIRNPDLFSDKS